MKANCGHAVFTPTAVSLLLPNSCSRLARKTMGLNTSWRGRRCLPRERRYRSTSIWCRTKSYYDNERDLHAGGLVFIPEDTWISLKNIGAGVRGHDEMQFRAGRRDAHVDHARGTKRVCTPGPCRKRGQTGTSQEMNASAWGTKTLWSLWPE
jgi:hypothetical protein